MKHLTSTHMWPSRVLPELSLQAVLNFLSTLFLLSRMREQGLWLPFVSHTLGYTKVDRGNKEVFKEEITQPTEPFTRQERDIININKQIFTLFKGTQQGNLNHYNESPRLAVKS